MILEHIPAPESTETTTHPPKFRGRHSKNHQVIKAEILLTLIRVKQTNKQKMLGKSSVLLRIVYNVPIGLSGVPVKRASQSSSTDGDSECETLDL